MVAISLDVADLAQMRFAISPLWEVCTSQLVLRRSGDPGIHRRWVAQARTEVNEQNLRRLASLAPSETYIADFLTPTDVASTRTLDDELEAMLTTPPDVLHRDLDALLKRQHLADTAWVAHLRGLPPRDALACVADEVRRYWDDALARHWPRVARLLQRDVATHSEQFAKQGIGPTLNRIHPRLRFRSGVLEIDGACETQHGPHMTGRGVALIASAFAWPDIHVLSNRPFTPTVTYGARGAGALWLDLDDDKGDAIDALLGAGRARVLRHIVIPATTSELAHALASAASTISQHLGVLRDAGLATTHRDGRNVVYSITPRGRSLLAVDAV